MSQIRVFDSDGKPLADLSAAVSRSWILNGTGTAIISIAKTDAKCTENNLRFGNLVLIEETDAGAWGGVILPPRRWGDHEVTVSAYTAERILKHRYYDAATTATGTAGDIFTTLIEDAEAIDDVFTLDTVYDGGESWTEEVQYTNTLEIMKRISARSGQDWSIEPALTGGGVLYFLARWHESRGTTRANVVLEEGTHFASTTLAFTEQGSIVNDLTLQAYTGTSTVTTVTASDAASIVSHGTYQGVFTESLPSGYTAQTYADYLLTLYKNPRRTFSLSVVNDTATLAYLGLGDIVGVRLMRYGFTENTLGFATTIRVLAKELDTHDSVMTIVADEST